VLFPCFESVCKYRNFFLILKKIKQKKLKIYLKTIVGKVHSGRKLFIFNIMQTQMMADVR